MNDIPLALKDILEQIQRNFIERFKDNIKCLILYGSWSKGTAREDSDIDLLAIFNRVNKETGKSVYEIERGIETERCITIVSSGIEDFQKEKLPLYTAVKREGKVMYGSVDMSINHEPPELKYSDFFKKSCEFESKKIEIAEELLKKEMGSGIADLCFIASKHAIQSALAMKGEGYSSKVAVLSPLAERYFGKEIVGAFRKLFELYIKSEYGIEFLSEEEAKLAVRYAKKVFEVYNTAG